MAREVGTKSHLNTGDKIEYALTVELNTTTKMWVRMSGETTVRDSESAHQAMKRLAGWVEDQLESKIDELT